VIDVNMKITRLTLVHFETFLIVKTTLIVALNFQMKFKVVPTSDNLQCS